MNEKDLLEQLKRSADDVTPLESLRPEHIEKMLLKQFHKEQSAHQDEKEPVFFRKTCRHRQKLPPAYFHLPPGRTGSRLCGGDRGLLAGRTPERFPYRRASSLLPDRLRKFQDRGKKRKIRKFCFRRQRPRRSGRHRPPRPSPQSDTAAPAETSLAPLVETIDPCRQLRSRLRSSL